MNDQGKSAMLGKLKLGMGAGSDADGVQILTDAKERCKPACDAAGVSVDESLDEMLMRQLEE